VRDRLVLAFLSSCVAAVLVYAGTRSAQFFFVQEPDPATIIWSAHAGYFWRSLVSIYAAGTIGFVAFVAAKTHADRLTTLLVGGVRLAAWAILVQALLFP
jgi:hypothetical protein